MKTQLWLAILAVLCPFVLIGQFSTHNAAVCQGAPRILCNTSLDGQSNAFGTDMLDTYTCSGQNPASGYNGNERIYRLEVNIRMEYDIRISGVEDPELDFDLLLMREGCESGDCINVSQNESNEPERITVILNPGTFYIIVDTWEGEIGTFDISVDCNQAPPPVLCEPAETLWCNDIVSGNTWGGTSNYTADLYDCYTGTGTFNGPDEIFSFTKDRSSDNLRLFLFTETPNLNIFLISQCDINGFNCALAGEPFEGGMFIDEGDLGLPAGEYYVIVDGRNSATDGEYSLLLECDAFDFSDADEVICGRPLENQSFAGGTDVRSLYGCEGSVPAPFNGPERSYFFDVAGLTDITIQLDRISFSGDLGLFLFQAGGGGTPICIDASIGTDRTLTINRTLASGRYYLVVDSRKEAFFDLSVFGCVCPIDGVLTCDETISASNAGGEDDIRFVAGDCFRNLRVDAQDRVYEFTAPDSGMYVFRLTNEEDLGIFIFDDCQRPSTCRGFSNTKADEDAVELVLQAGETVFIAVDGIARLVTSTFDLSVTCNTVPDSDNDGIIDMLDNCPDRSNPDQADNDGDGMGDVCDDDDDNDGVNDIDDCDRLDPMINFAVGDACDDGDLTTENDVIRFNCGCQGTPRSDLDGDGIFDDEDNCPDMPNADQADMDGDTVGDVCDNDLDNDGIANGEDCAPTDASIALVLGAPCDDGDDETTGDIIEPGCLCAGTPINRSIQLFVGNATGDQGDVECIDITATEFTDVASGSFSVSINPQVAQVVEINNLALNPGTFTGSLCMAGGTNQAFVVWSAEPGSSLTLGPATPIVEVCYEFTSPTQGAAIVTITDDCRPAEFFDVNGDPIDFESNMGILSNLGARTGSGMAIGGTITDASRLGVASVAVQLMDDDGEADVYMTGDDGVYALNATEGESYEIIPNSMEETRLELSALDVMLFRQHFVFAKTFTHPHQFIAADIDGNGTLSVRDELLLTRMILGIYDGDAPVWRFVDANHEFIMPEDFSISGPIFDYPNSVRVESILDDMDQDFLGIRVGDLSVLDMTAYNRSSNREKLEIQDVEVRAGERVTVPIHLLKELEMTGMAVELNYDSERLSLEDIRGLQSSLPIKFDTDTPGVISIDWIETRASQISVEDEILSLTFDVKSAGALSQMISLSPSQTNVISNNDGGISRLDLQFSTESGLSLSITPNPAISNIFLEVYNSSQETQGEVAIYDMSGRMLLRYEQGLTHGQNVISIDPSSVDLIDGIYIVELTSNETVIRDRVAYLR